MLVTKNILVQLKFLKGRVHEPVVQHVRLFVVMGCKNNIINNVFKCLPSPDQMDSMGLDVRRTHRTILTLVVLYRWRVPHLLIVLRNIQIR